MFCPRCGTWLADGAPACTLCGAALAGGGPPGAAVTPLAPAVAEVTYGGFWRRLMAVLLDTLILFFPAATVRVLLGLSPLDMFDPESPASYVATSFEMLLDWLYGACFICSSARGTLGMQVMDLHATDLNGDRVSFARATWRYLAQLLTLLTFGFGYLLQLFTPRRQTLHDLVSGTVVVRPRRAPGATLAPVMRYAP